MRRGFTLIELLVVIVIIVIISAVALPTILPALAHRQVGEAARILQSSLIGARDAAIRDNAPSGIRFLPDPIFNGIDPKTGKIDNSLPLAYNRLIPLEQAPDYSEGIISTATNAATLLGAATKLPYPVGTNQIYPLAQILAVSEDVIGSNGLLSPTNWFWNIRVGDKLQIGGSGNWYTVIGPMSISPDNGNPEMFVNIGVPGTTSSLPNTAEFLLLANGVDDNQDGMIEPGWNGLDENGDNVVDDIAEWQVTYGVVTTPEFEAWQGSLLNSPATNAKYVIQRRPMPTTNAREVSMPSDVVIDATGWGAAGNFHPERSRFPAGAFNAFTGVLDVIVNPDGSIVPTTIYSSPASLSLNGSFYHFWLAERGDVYPPSYPLVTGGVFGLPMPLDAIELSEKTPFGTPTKDAYAAIIAKPGNGSLPVLKGENRIVTLFTRSGQISTNDNPTFNTLNVSQPYFEAQRGLVAP